MGEQLAAFALGIVFGLGYLLMLAWVTFLPAIGALWMLGWLK